MLPTPQASDDEEPELTKEERHRLIHRYALLVAFAYAGTALRPWGEAERDAEKQLGELLDDEDALVFGYGNSFNHILLVFKDHDGWPQSQVHEIVRLHPSLT